MCVCLQRSKRFALKSKAIAVAVTSDDWDAPVQLTSADLQALPLQRMADLWRVTILIFIFPPCFFASAEQLHCFTACMLL